MVALGLAAAVVLHELAHALACKDRGRAVKAFGFGFLEVGPGFPTEPGQTVTPGNVEELSAKLARLATVLPGNSEIRQSARACASRYTWPAFRKALRKTLTAE